MAEFKPPAVAPVWSKYSGVRLADLSSDDLRDLHRQARAVSFRLTIEQELRRRARPEHRQRPRNHPPRAFA